MRPKMMTVAVIMAAVLPIMWSTGAGTDPMAGGMISSTGLTLGVIPAIQAWVKQWQLCRT